MALSMIMVLPGDIVLSEIMYNPDGPTLGADDSFEWVELCNLSPEPVQLEGMMLSDGGNQLFLDSYALSPLSRVIVAADPDSFQSAYGYSAAVVYWDGEWTKLSNSSDQLILYSASGEVLDELAYSDEWGIAEGDSTRSGADGSGSSLEKIDLSGPNGPGNWAPSVDYACPSTDPDDGSSVCWGTPGEINSLEAQ